MPKLRKGDLVRYLARLGQYRYGVIFRIDSAKRTDETEINVWCAWSENKDFAIELSKEYDNYESIQHFLSPVSMKYVELVYPSTTTYIRITVSEQLQKLIKEMGYE